MIAVDKMTAWLMTLLLAGLPVGCSGAVPPALPSRIHAPAQRNSEALSRIFVHLRQRIKNSIVEINAVSIKKTVRKVITTTSQRMAGHHRPVSTRHVKTTTTVVTTTNVGSGVIWSRRGYIVTNAHVIYQAGNINVILADRRTYPARVIGTDPVADLAVIQIKAPFLSPATFGNSSRLKPGQWVVDFGAPFRLPQSMTQGIISALHRRNNHVTSAEDSQIKLLAHENFIQVDSAIDPGSSGGALVNLQGKVVGINESIKSGGSGSFSGVGFVIPSNEVTYVVHQLITKGNVVHGHLGIRVREDTMIVGSGHLQTLLTGLRINRIAAGSSAEHAGLRRGDMIVKLQGRAIHHAAQLYNRVAFTKPGTTLIFNVWRKNRFLTVDVATAK
jgi:S1-C subfamily serine protease